MSNSLYNSNKWDKHEHFSIEMFEEGDEMLSTIGIPGLILILVITLIIFGPKKLPEIGKATGQTLKEFKHSARELTNEEADHAKKVESNDQNAK